jgi:dihydrofolate synthase / folylpolyglutamate synthase
VTYEESLAYIASLEPRGWRLGLDRMQEFARRASFYGALGEAGGPQFIHVAGTNGKGSVTAMVESILRTAGHRTGSFYSPYVVDPRERIQLNGELIAKEDLARITERLKVIATAMEATDYAGITEFEFKTGVGFAYWQEQKADWVALEVGLGGRLDATNVVKPAASVIVSIGLDHVAILGDSLAAIAFEKAGIVKPGVPVIVGEMSPEARRTVEVVAQDRKAPIWRFGYEIRLEGRTMKTPAGSIDGLEPGLVGAMQLHNSALAVAAVQASGAEVSIEAMQQGIRQAWLPGRFQRVRAMDTDFIFDGAHNAAAAEILVSTLRQVGIEKVNLITNMLRGHDPNLFYRVIAPLVQEAHVVPIDFPRAIPVPEAQKNLRPILANVVGHETVEDAVMAVRGSELPVLVTASNYVVGAVMRSLELG